MVLALDNSLLEKDYTGKDDEKMTANKPSSDNPCRVERFRTNPFRPKGTEI